MKDYSLNDYEKNKFILNYEIKDGNIIINLANGNNYTIPCCEENEKKVLEIMEHQARNTDKVEKKLKFLIILGRIMTIIGGCCIATSLRDIIYAHLWNAQSWNNYLIFAKHFFITAWPYYFLLYRNKNIMQDIKKTQYYLLHQQELNKNIKNNDSVTLGMSKESIEQIKQTPAEKPVFDINSIDKYSLNDLKTLRHNIQANSQIKFDFIEPMESKNIEGEYTKVFKK